MRLHMLEIRAFGPYAAPQRIDFDLLTASGLFLLEGPTGAGKSTILDAVTFALYGGLAGEEAGEDRLRSHFAGPAAEPSAILEFSVRGARYRITRVPEHRRPKKRGEGFTTEASRVHLERMAAGGWSCLSSNKAEAGEAITEAVGLNREQFTQVMLLPQGEFARFLRARDDDRRVLLTKLFGTQLYDRVTAELDRRRAEAGRQRDRADRAVADAVSAAAEAAGLDTDARAELLALSRNERETRLKEAGEHLDQLVALTGQGLDVAAGGVAAARAADEAAKRQAALMTRLAQALADLRGHEATRAEHDRRAARLDAARRAEPVRPLLTVLAEMDAIAGQARDELLRLIPAPGVDMLAGRGGAEARDRAEAAERGAAGLQHLADVEDGLARQEAELRAEEEAARQAWARVAALEEARSELPARIAQLEGERDQAAAAAGGLGAARARLDEITVWRDAACAAAELAPQVEAASSAVQAAVASHQALVDAHQAAVGALLGGMAAELAAQLTAGAPCPVCGSPEHPAPARAHDGAVSAEDVAGLAEQRDEAERERARLEVELARLDREWADLVAAAGGRAMEDLAAEAETLASAAAVGERSAADAERLTGELAKARAELEAGAIDLREAAAQEAAASQQVTMTRAALEALRTDLASAAQDHPSVAARQSALRETAAQDRDLARALDTLSAALAGQAKAHQQAEREASAQRFASLDDARAAVVEPLEQAALAAEVESWTGSLARLEAAVHADDLADLDLGRAEEIHARAEEAEAALTHAQEAEHEVRAAHEARKAQADRLRGRLAEVREAEGSLDRLVEETEPVIRLAALVKGTDGHRRVSLTTYVLRHWFGQVVAAANVRLSAMSSGRYELKRTDEGGTRRERAGLTLAVIDRHTGTERSPASLSGGETFYTSLALALGLADVVKAEAGGVDLDTLFIDEGFGSLDADTLDDVMAVIDDLRDRGRVVGIVSHVADLKDRVPERLEVRRLPDGSSAMRVVA
jgi:DNA repair protein SbcC/Rad50